MNLRNAAQELIELGPGGTAFRVGWELRLRAGLTSIAPRSAAVTIPEAGRTGWAYRLQLEDPVTLARSLRGRVPAAALRDLKALADGAVQGRILCFGRWVADFGDPIDWHRSPRTGERWSAEAPWFRALADERPGDVKYAWEAARFPHAYHIARAASFFPEEAERYAEALASQFESFTARNPIGFGIHWASGQEVGFRLLAWLFALDVLLSRTAAGRRAEPLVADALVAGARHIEEHLDYARIAVYNNHLLSEALALYAVGVLVPDVPEAPSWRELGRRILDEESGRQFYADGGYIQQSHNYHRVALQNYLWACSFARSTGDSPSPSWIRALTRSLDLLVAHQNPSDGRLPNYGSNDGALPSILDTCDYSDMRPVLQAVSVLARGERLFEPGPWDETTAWFLGVRALDAPLKAPARTSVSFEITGHHVLRGNDAGHFCAFRCGTLRDRFSQIDMLHADVWWRGRNVLVDAGSYQYNAAPKWHEHFMGTASHNTVVVDGRDQMTHHRQFKVLYWTKARLTRFADEGGWAICGGEHYGYRRHDGRCVHRREVLFVKDDLWIVADHVTGTGSHAVRLHWLGGDYDWTEAASANGFELRTPAGIFTVSAFDADGQPLTGDVVAGDEEAPRGWLSRYYGEKVPVPSFAATHAGDVPLTMVSVLSGAAYEIAVEGRRWNLSTPELAVSFDIISGSFESIAVTR